MIHHSKKQSIFQYKISNSTKLRISRILNHIGTTIMCRLIIPKSIIFLMSVNQLGIRIAIGGLINNHNLFHRVIAANI